MSVMTNKEESARLAQRADELSREAVRLQDEDLLTKALTDLETAIELDPENARAYVSRATIYAGRQRYTDAHLDLRRAEELGYDKEIIDHMRATLLSTMFFGS